METVAPMCNGVTEAPAFSLLEAAQVCGLIRATGRGPPSLLTARTMQAGAQISQSRTVRKVPGKDANARWDFIPGRHESTGGTWDPLHISGPSGQGTWSMSRTTSKYHSEASWGNSWYLLKKSWCNLSYRYHNGYIDFFKSYILKRKIPISQAASSQILDSRESSNSGLKK